MVSDCQLYRHSAPGPLHESQLTWSKVYCNKTQQQHATWDDLGTQLLLGPPELQPLDWPLIVTAPKTSEASSHEAVPCVLQRPFDPASSHCVMPATMPRSADPAAAATAAGALDAAARRRSGGGGPAAARLLKGQKVESALVMPDLAAVLGQMAAMGDGLVADVLAAPSTLALAPHLAHVSAQDSE